MIRHSRFASEFEVAIADYPASGPDHVFAAEGAGSRAVLVIVEPRGEPSWAAAFAGSDPGRSALAAFVGTPSPTGLCVVERGTAFMGDVWSRRASRSP